MKSNAWGRRPNHITQAARIIRAISTNNQKYNNFSTQTSTKEMDLIKRGIPLWFKRLEIKNTGTQRSASQEHRIQRHKESQQSRLDWTGMVNFSVLTIKLKDNSCHLSTVSRLNNSRQRINSVDSPTTKRVSTRNKGNYAYQFYWPDLTNSTESTVTSWVKPFIFNLNTLHHTVSQTREIYGCYRGRHHKNVSWLGGTKTKDSNPKCRLWGGDSTIWNNEHLAYHKCRKISIASDWSSEPD